MSNNIKNTINKKRDQYITFFSNTPFLLQKNKSLLFKKKNKKSTHQLVNIKHQ